MSISPTMSSRTGTIPISKVSSSENVCAKSKEDRKRNNNFAKAPNSYHQENTTSSYSCNRAPGNGKGSVNQFQKQPRSRSGFKNGGGRRNQVKAEQRDAFSPLPVEQHGSKKTNMNHLLNFTFDSSFDESSPRTVSRGGYNRWRQAGHHHHFKKEQFIQANCQLVVKEGPDYSFHVADADLPIDWELIEKVNMWSHVTPLCPICLDSPNAGRVTKCGHIFCWPCILHYLALDTKSWRKCPICYEPVHKSDLKSVSVYEDQFYDPQSILTMKLMKRQKGSMIAFPADHDSDFMMPSHMSSFVSVSKSQVLTQRNLKYLYAAPEQVISNIVQVEMEQLEFKLATESDDLEKQFIYAALELCKQRQAELLECIEQNQGHKVSSVNPEDTKQQENNSNNAQVAEETTKPSGPMESPTDHMYYFYQAKDGQHIYLHPVNVKCLIHQYGSFDKCPKEITGKILETEDYTMNENTRKRHRYLMHLPLSLEFHVTELDLRPPVVERSTLEAFRDHLERRAAQRKRKARDEKRVLRKGHNAEMRKQGKYPAARISLESQKQFPQFPGCSNATPGSFSVLLPTPETSQSENAQPYNASEEFFEVGSSSSVSPIVASAASSVDNSAGPSFAQMLRSAKSNEQQLWPRIAPSTSKISQASNTSSLDVNDDEDPDYVAPPTYQSSFGDALSTALSQLSTGASEAPKSRGKKGKGGKKGKKVLLFSTAGQQHQ